MSKQQQSKVVEQQRSAEAARIEKCIVRDAPSSPTVDKCLYESGRTDSGCISDVIHSELSISTELHPEPASPHGHPTAYSKQSSYSGCTDSGFLDTDSRKLDSDCGGLNDQFSDLDLNKSSQNDLNSSPTSRSRSDLQQQQQQEQEQTKLQYDPLLQYFVQDDDGDTQLHLAILQGFIEVVFGLIRMAPHPVFLDVPNNCMQTPLHLAVLTSQAPIVRALLIAGASPSARDGQGNTALHLAAQQGAAECVRAIISPVSIHDTTAMGLRYNVPPPPPCAIDLANYDGERCVHLAAAGGHVEVLRHLVWAGADVNARESKAGRTALHVAAERGRRRAALLLMSNECPGTDLSALTYAGYTAYELACYTDPTLARKLLQAGARTRGRDSSSESDSESETEDIGVEVVGRYPPEGYIRSVAVA